MKTWWRVGMDVGFELTRISKEFDKPDNAVWDVEGFKFKLLNKDIEDGDYIEEQLWAMGRGLA